MKFKSALGAAILGVSASLLVSAAHATPRQANPDAAPFAVEYGQALPPVGYVQLCLTTPQECKSVAASTAKFVLSAARWNLLFRVNLFVNGKIKPVSDQELYGKAEYWTVPTNAGDCEDYLLLKKRLLQSLGFPSNKLKITVVLDEKGDGHAVLTIAAADGDYILDNRSDDILRWNETQYTFLKRQSEANPMQWVALSQQKTSVFGQLSASQAK
jgi:predicted transglutaminase-like cysteine proteinase